MFYNKSILVGRLTKDPESNFTQSGKQVVKFTLVVNRPFINKQTNQRDCDFIPITVWGKQAEACANYLSKGRLVLVDGRIQVSKYTDQQGQNRIFTEVVANAVRFLEKKDNGNNYGTKQPAEQPGETNSFNGFDNFPSDDFPSFDDFGGFDDNPPF